MTFMSETMTAECRLAAERQLIGPRRRDPGAPQLLRRPGKIMLAVDHSSGYIRLRCRTQRKTLRSFLVPEFSLGCVKRAAGPGAGDV